MPIFGGFTKSSTNNSSQNISNGSSYRAVLLDSNFGLRILQIVANNNNSTNNASMNNSYNNITP